ncbi:MAG: hypothetical protein AB8V52_01885 [Coxiella endosymbiont of Dermacentor nuttalli]
MVNYASAQAKIFYPVFNCVVALAILLADIKQILMKFGNKTWSN